MLTAVQDAVNQLLPAKRKHNSSSGWTSFNAVCCQHNGESPDTRGRGGIISNANGSVSYACFNCNFKANYTPGRHLTYKFRKLLSWLGASDNEVKRLVIDAIRVKDLVAPETVQEEQQEVVFKPRPLPEDCVSFAQWRTFLALQNEDDPVHPQFVKAFNYIYERKIDFDKYEFYTTESPAYNLHKRIIIPFYWKNSVIGYTARTFDDTVKPKYHSQYEPNYVFNVDTQTPDRKFVIVVEGPFDAMAIDGVAILGNEVSEVQADIIDSLGREVIVVPDNDRAGRSLVDQATEYGWSVSFPVWHEDCKDVNEAVIKYGRLFVLKAIIAGKESSKLKIELKKKKMHDGS
jgi:Toprim-like